MADLRHKHKQIRFGFGGTNEGRLIRANKQEKSRKEERAKNFNKVRNITESPSDSPYNQERKLLSTKTGHPVRLQKWKKEQEMRKKMQKVKEKPPFKVGIVHHRVYSPINYGPANARAANNQVKRAVVSQPFKNEKKITKATEKRLRAKALADEHLLGNKKQKNWKIKEEKLILPDNNTQKATSDSSEVLTFGQTPVKMESLHEHENPVLHSQESVRLDKEDINIELTIEHNNSKENTLINANKESGDNSIADSSIEPVSLRLSLNEEDLVNSGNNDEEEIKNTLALNKSITKPPSSSSNTSVVTPSDSPNEPAFFSPYIVSSRGKSSARKEQQIRRGFSIGHSPTDNIPTKDTVMMNLNISVEEEARTAQYFRFLLNKEIERLNELCDKWATVKLKSSLSEDAHYLINQAIGQTCLLINKKFERFRRLISDCESGKGEMLVTCSDLQGFWDMMYMDVKNCDSRFDNLENLRSRNWKEEQQIVKPIVKKKVAAKKKIVPAKPSTIKAFLLEKKKMAQKAKSAEITNGSDPTNEQLEKNESSYIVKHKTKRSRSIGPGGQKSTPAKRESTRMSLLQKVQLSEASRTVRSPLAVMKISKLYKTPEIQLDDSISYVNSDQTPGKSILKTVKDPTESESREKLAHKVNFDDSVVLREIPVDEETQTKMDLAEALARINSIDFDSFEEKVPIRAERKLNFVDDSSDESQDEHGTEEQDLDVQNSMDIPSLKVQSTPPMQDLLSDTSLQSRRASSRERNSVVEKNMNLPVINVLPATPMVTSQDTELRVSNETLRKDVRTDQEEERKKMDTSVKVLRNRIVSSNDTPKTNTRKSKRISVIGNERELKENNSPLRIRKESPLKIRKKSLSKAKSIGEKMSDSEAYSEDAIDLVSFDVSSGRNIDTRKSNTRSSKRISVIANERELKENKSPLKLRKKSLSKAKSIEEKKNNSEGHFEDTIDLNTFDVSSGKNIDTPKSNTKSSKRISVIANERELKENKSPLKIRKKSLSKVKSIKQKMSDSEVHFEDAIDLLSVNASSGKRKTSIKRNVKFEEEDISRSDEYKPTVLPMTPHTRRSKTRLNKNKEGGTLMEDNIPDEMIVEPPERVRRSKHRKL